jgi:hypothetical protein
MLSGFMLYVILVAGDNLALCILLGNGNFSQTHTNRLFQAHNELGFFQI